MTHHSAHRQTEPGIATGGPDRRAPYRLQPLFRLCFSRIQHVFQKTTEPVFFIIFLFY